MNTIKNISCLCLLIWTPLISQSLTPPSQQFVLRFFSDQILVVPSTTQLDLGASFTMECWVYLESASPNSFVMGKATSSPYTDPNFYYMLGFADSTRARFVMSTGQPGSSRTALASIYIPLRTWTHLAATLDNNIMRLYVNGDSVGTATSNGSPQEDHTVQFTLGTSITPNGGTAFGFSGAMRQARAWGRTLSSLELKTNAVKYLTGSEAALVASWPLDDGAGQTVRDQKQNYNLILGLSPDDRMKDPQWIRNYILENGPYFSMKQTHDPNKNLGTGKLIDFNNDGKLDLILSTHLPNFAPSPILFLRNDGTGNFSDVTTLMFGPNPPTAENATDYTVLDVNNDGLMDFLVCSEGNNNLNYDGSQIKLLVQKPGGLLVDETALRLPQRKDAAEFIPAADINGDRFVDFFVGTEGSPTSISHFCLNDGTGKFRVDTTILPLEFQHRNGGGFLLDVNNDGYPDLIWPKQWTTDPDAVLLNDGTGHFKLANPGILPPEPLASDESVRSPNEWVAADLNKDGYTDLLFISSIFGTGQEIVIWYLLNNHDGTFSDVSDRIPLHLLPIDGLGKIIVADINNDGWLDILVPGTTNSMPTQLFLNKGNGSFVDCSDLIPNSYSFYGLAAADLDGDKKTDIIMWGGNEFAVLKNIKLFNLGEIPIAGIISITPSQGSVGTMITIQGTNLAGIKDVQFNGKSANFQSVSESQIIAQVPAGASTGHVRLNTASGVVYSQDNFFVPLIVYGFSPMSGVGGQKVLISGSNFTGATAVQFGGVNSPSFTVADSQIVAVVPANGNTGSITIVTPNGTASSPSNFIVVTPPIQRYSLKYNGNQVAEASLSSYLNLGSEFTLEAWIYVEQGKIGSCSIMGKARDPLASDPDIVYCLQFSGDGKKFVFAQATDQPGSTRIATSSADCPIRTWTHLAATLGGSTMRLYVNGSQVATQQSPGAPVNNEVQFSIGAAIDRKGQIVKNGLIGALRQVRVWNRALLPTEIQVNSSKYLSGNDSSLVAYWPLDDSTGQTARDLGPNKLPLTLGSTPGIDNNDPAWITLLGSLAVSGNSLDFGNVIRDSTIQAKVFVTNPSFVDVRIDSMYNSSQVFRFLTAGFPVILKNGDSVNVNLRFHPDSLKQFRDTLFIQNNSNIPLMKIALSGNSPAPSITSTTSGILFGNVRKDSTASQTFKISNNSINFLQVDSLWTKTKNFTVVKFLLNKIVRNKDTVQISLSFRPDSSRSFLDTLYIANNSPVSPLKIPLSGNGTLTGVSQFGAEIPKDYMLCQNYPNPFNPSTTIRFGVPMRSRVDVNIFNMLGQRVVQFVNQEVSAGYYEKIWNANVASGLYFYRLEATAVDDASKRFIDVKKMILLK